MHAHTHSNIITYTHSHTRANTRTHTHAHTHTSRSRARAQKEHHGTSRPPQNEHKEVKVDDILGAAEAKQVIKDALNMYQEHYVPKKLRTTFA
jgi:inorganic pyrophosphatase